MCFLKKKFLIFFSMWTQFQILKKIKKKCKLFSIKTSCHTVFFLYIAYYFVVHYPANECHEYKNKIISVLYNINISIELSYKQILILELNSKKEVFFVKNKWKIDYFCCCLLIIYLNSDCQLKLIQIEFKCETKKSSGGN